MLKHRDKDLNKKGRSYCGNAGTGDSTLLVERSVRE